LKALIISGNSQTGSEIIKILRAHNWQALGTCYSRQNPEFLPLDITDRSAVENCILSVKPQVIFLAVILRGGADYCEQHPEATRALNVEGTRYVLEAAQKVGAKLVFYSSDYVFDGTQGPYLESDPLTPISAYGRAKAEAESLILNMAPGSLILRTTAVFGWNRNSINFAMQLWANLTQGKQVSIANDQWCTPTLTSYLAEVSVGLVLKEASGVFNVVGSDRLTRYDWAVQIARAFDQNTELILSRPTSELSQAAPRPLHGGLKVEKITRVYGIAAMNLNEALALFRRDWQADIVRHV
jgi:dTDP-4-dehydrorhamnose reductase